MTRDQSPFQPSQACIALRQSLNLQSTGHIPEGPSAKSLISAASDQHKSPRRQPLANSPPAEGHDRENLQKAYKCGTNAAAPSDLSAQDLWLRQQTLLQRESRKPCIRSILESHRSYGQHCESRSWSPAQKRGNHGSPVADPCPPWRSPGKSPVPLGKSSCCDGERSFRVLGV